MSSSEIRVVRVVRAFAASAERVFGAWLDPAMAKRFLFVTNNGEIVTAEIDARVGGRFRIIRRDGEDVEHVGTYLEIDRPRKLVFTFSVPKFSKAVTRVCIELKPVAGGCELTLTHEGVLPEWVERSREGWGMILDGLGRCLAKAAASAS